MIWSTIVHACGYQSSQKLHCTDYLAVFFRTEGYPVKGMLQFRQVFVTQFMGKRRIVGDFRDGRQLSRHRFSLINTHTRTQNLVIVLGVTCFQRCEPVLRTGNLPGFWRFQGTLVAVFGYPLGCVDKSSTFSQNTGHWLQWGGTSLS